MSLALAIQQVMLPPNYGPLYKYEPAKNTRPSDANRRTHTANLVELLTKLGTELTIHAALEAYKKTGHRLDTGTARKIFEQLVESDILKRRKATTGGRPRVYYSIKVKS